MHIATTQTASSSIGSTVRTDARARFATIAIAAAALDLLTKAWATSALSDGQLVSITDRLALLLVYNTRGAGGLTMGPYTWLINIAVTALAILMVVRVAAPLAVFDPRSTAALALVTGGAFGNLASMLAGPEGVADFLAVQLGFATIVMNVADLLLWGGALLLLPVVFRLIAAVRAERLTR